MAQLTLWSEDRPVNPSPSPDNGKEWTELLDSSVSIFDFLKRSSQCGLFGKTSPEYFQATKDETFPSSCPSGTNSAITSATESLMLNTSESHNAAEECLLSDILETGEIPQRYFLSQKACEGILRRAERRGKRIPDALKQALTRQALLAATQKVSAR